MKEWLANASDYAIILIDAMALVVVVYAAVEAFVRASAAVFKPLESERRSAIWLRFSRWLVAALTFQLAADIIETSISTTWESLGRIAVIAVIRTFLNYFLEKDVERLEPEPTVAAVR
jgi:uncharacterized membrane protein